MGIDPIPFPPIRMPKVGVDPIPFPLPLSPKTPRQDSVLLPFMPPLTMVRPNRPLEVHVLEGYLENIAVYSASSASGGANAVTSCHG